MSDHDNPNAFPDGRLFNGIAVRPGMSLRDYFAGQALTGYIAAPDFGEMTAVEVAEHCYATADAMLAARKESIR